MTPTNHSEHTRSSKFAFQFSEWRPEAHLVRLTQDKRPAFPSSWKHRPATPGQVCAWPELIGLVPASVGLFCVDIDKGGQAGLEAVQERLGAKPVAMIPSIRKGGLHAYFRLNGPGCGNFSWKIGEFSGDVRCLSGYVVLWRTVAIRLVRGLNRIDQYTPVDPNCLRPDRPSHPKKVRRKAPKPGRTMAKESPPAERIDWRDTQTRNITLLAVLRSVMGKPANWKRGPAFALRLGVSINSRFRKGPLPLVEVKKVASQAVLYRDRDLASGELQRKFSRSQRQRGRLGGVASGKARRRCPMRLYWTKRCRVWRSRGQTVREIAVQCPYGRSWVSKQTRGVSGKSCPRKPIPYRLCSEGSSSPSEVMYERVMFLYRAYEDGIQYRNLLASRAARRLLRRRVRSDWRWRLSMLEHRAVVAQSVSRVG